jgi:hypothetical protein
MAEVTNELLYEVLKQVQQDTGALKEGQRETRESLAAIRTYWSHCSRTFPISIRYLPGMN